MSKVIAEQENLPHGYTIIESTHAILGVGTDKVVAIRGGTHPKMRLLVKDANTEMVSGDGLSGAYSYAFSVVYHTSGVIFDVLHKDAIIAGRTAAGTANHEIYPFAPVAAADESVFKANEDIILQPSTAHGGATGASIVFLKFEVVN